MAAWVNATGRALAFFLAPDADGATPRRGRPELASVTRGMPELGEPSCGRASELRIARARPWTKGCTGARPGARVPRAHQWRTPGDAAATIHHTG